RTFFREYAVVFVIVAILFNQGISGNITDIYQLKFISPSELIESLGLQESSPDGYIVPVDNSKVNLRINKLNNKILLIGNDPEVKTVKELISFMDVPARQIIVEVKIIEIDDSKIKETGINWQEIIDGINYSVSYRTGSDEQVSKRNQESDIDGSVTETVTDLTTSSNSTSKGLNISLGSVSFGEILKIIEETNAGTITNAPRIVTINNKTGKIIDGNRITYVSRYSSYTNLFETQELTTGLSVEVTPTIGDGDYLKMAVIAKLTTLGSIISGSPSETGQIIENTIIVKNNEPFLMGEFKQTQNSKNKKRVPVIGAVLPFLFSQDVNVTSTKHILLVLKPEIIDLNPASIPDIK
ncbi:MAG: hypothetical protein PHW79_05330, partial [Candidatus Marinimicrobia bacterium]|nr:hypothetical protein [Candidatus Neomarinimicrobiota bacterium]